MNRFFIGVLTTLAIGAVTVATVVFAGVINVSAVTPHSDLVYSLLTTARERSIESRLHDIDPPDDLLDAERIRRGAGNYAAMCADCHLTPARSDSELRMGLYPTPPDLARGESRGEGHHPEARQFWIIKHGIKASGMPAWSKGGIDDAAIWDLVAFIGRLPTLSDADYDQLVASSDGHSHAGMDQHHEAMHEEEGLSPDGMSLPDGGPPQGRHGDDGHTH